MLTRNINSIIYQSYIKLGEISSEITEKINDGIGGRELDKLWTRAILIDQYLDVIANHIVVKNNSVYQILGITENEMNKLLSCLVEVSKITNFPVAPFLIVKDITTISSGSGAQGPPGNNGVSAYAAIAFAADTSGTDFSTSPSPTRPYVAFKSSNAPIALTPLTFAGLWVKYIGDNGNNGSNGEDGVTYYHYIRFASDASGTNFSSSPSSSRRYIANLITTTDYVGNPPSIAFNGLWVEYIGQNGQNGTNGTDGKTIIITSGAPDPAIGNDGDVALDTTNWYIYAAKSNGVWPIGHPLTGPVGPQGPSGTNGTNGTNGNNAYVYIAWADDVNGNGFTTIFDQNKEWIGVISTDTAILNLQSSDFTGKWAKYRGDGDRWNTTSSTLLTIGTGAKSLVVGSGLAYSTGQRVVIAQNGIPGNRMEGYVIDYNPMTGQMTVDVTNSYGSGTYDIWDVNIQGIPNEIITTDSYYAEIYTFNNSGGTPQSLTTTPVKISQFLAVGDVSSGMTASHSDDNIIPQIVGEFQVYVNLTISGTANAAFIIQVYKNGTAVASLKAIEVLDATGNPKGVSLEGLKSTISGDVWEVRVSAVSGTPDFLVQEGTFGMFTTGTPATPEYTRFGGLDFDTGVGVIIDAFPTTDGNVVIWDYKIKKGNNILGGRVSAHWDSLGNLQKENSFINTPLGTIDVVLDIAISGGNVRLLADLTSDDWEISGNRYIL